MNWAPRLARFNDVPALERLIPQSARALQAGCYTPEQIESALGPVFGVDRQLIEDGTYYVVEAEGRVAGGGGWSRRRAQYGGDRHRAPSDPELNPEYDAARVRAFFVHPRWARRGIGSSIMKECERAIAAAGFRRVEITATPVGEPLYRSFGYEVIERAQIALPGVPPLPIVRLAKAVKPNSAPSVIPG